MIRRDSSRTACRRRGGRCRRRAASGWAPTWRIFWKHLFPHLLPILLVWGTLGVSTTVMFEASLSFLGVGVRPPTPSWGGTINESQSYFLEAPWLVAFPGAAILLTSLAFNLVGDTLRDAIDPQLRSR